LLRISTDRTSACIPGINLRPLTNELGGRLDYNQPSCQTAKLMVSTKASMLVILPQNVCSKNENDLHRENHSHDAHAFTRWNV